MGTTTDLLIARNGQKFADSSAAIASATITDNYIYIVINEDAVLATLVSSAGTNLITSIGISGKTVTKGMIVAAPNGQFITDATFTSGSGFAIKG
jgi:hypothetical protein